jgi:fatty-acyl-CoA synthase
MAALVADDGLDLAALRAHLHALLPDYARPRFLRRRGEIEVTMTFKQKKVDLVAQGFDPAQSADAIYFDDPRVGAFVQLDAALYEQIIGGTIKI